MSSKFILDSTYRELVKDGQEQVVGLMVRPKASFVHGDDLENYENLLYGAENEAKRLIRIYTNLEYTKVVSHRLKCWSKLKAKPLN